MTCSSYASICAKHLSARQLVEASISRASQVCKGVVGSCSCSNVCGYVSCGSCGTNALSGGTSLVGRVLSGVAFGALDEVDRVSVLDLV